MSRRAENGTAPAVEMASVDIVEVGKRRRNEEEVRRSEVYIGFRTAETRVEREAAKRSTKL